MIDFHSHVLPGIDDGSRNAAMTFEMLREDAAQGASAVVATPHFYPTYELPEQFLTRRAEAVRQLAECGESLPCPVYLGAEVAYFDGISRCAQLHDLCIVGTDCILVEMPFARWTETVISELVALRAQRGLYPIVAHIERYISAQPRGTLTFLCEQGVIVQSNAAYFCDWHTRRRALRLLHVGQIHLIGTDCHNMTRRPPDYAPAIDRIRAKYGEEMLCGLHTFAASLLRDAIPMQL